MSNTNATTESRKVVLTCAQPTGRLHLGNYLGAVRHWAAMIDAHECYFGIVDLHAITLPYVPADLRKSTYETLAVYIACGLDPAKAHLFVQSHVTGHTELSWILGCLCPLGQLERMTQYKDKSKKVGESVGSGLLTYPLLMAADILLYNADLVPVGEDQKQHVELCRDLAEKFNHTYSATFTVPAPVIPPVGARIRSLQDPLKKMSKSDENQNGCLYLLDEPTVLKKKVMSAVTDSGTDILAKDDKPGVSNLLEILSAVTGRSISSLEDEYNGKLNYGAFKAVVADAVIAHFEPIRSKYNELASDRAALDAILKQGAAAAQKRAYKTLSKVYRKCGFVEMSR